MPDSTSNCVSSAKARYRQIYRQNVSLESDKRQ
jgi:hypothetical protein